MKRRAALKNVLFSATGLLTLPAWGNSWNAETLKQTKSIFTTNQAQILDILVDALIPSGEIIGAKDLETSVFINKMLSDCYEKLAQESFKNGLENADKLTKETFSKSLIECDKIHRNEVLVKLSMSTDTQQKEFFALLKQLTVLAYTTSEYVLTKHYNYVMAPGHYYGCVNV
ncbi:gluconate 2-dehydrogenase subunit 3 family protein [Emticicia sp. SJ17W-69]|uniref:gluconate 2-dehydrogenase subunit 3 family protein n=1 Tax=Emticicia sp. SJ17W-69 TaxID=3421657 RepID=UPI003EB9E221